MNSAVTHPKSDRSIFSIYKAPLVSLFSGWKVIGAGIVSVLYEILEFLNLDLLSTPEELISGLAILVIIDFFSGVVSSWRSGEKIQSIKLRATVIKTVEYVLFLGAISTIYNTFGQSGGEIADYILKNIRIFAFFLVAVTEANSIAENTDMKGIWSKIKEKTGISS